VWRHRANGAKLPAEQRTLLALTLAGVPEERTADAAQAAAAARELQLGVRDAVVSPTRAPITSDSRSAVLIAVDRNDSAL